ncbi:MAG: peptidoglycan-binding domain-containing protein [Christensenellales bacterium]
MNNKPLAGLALVILLAMPLSALAEATAGEAVWTPPVVTAEEMEAARLGERIVMRGQEGDDVRLVQQRLYDLGYLSGSVDGKFGLQTQKAVRAFQRAHKLEKIDGKVGQQTLAALLARIVHTTLSPAQPDATSVPTARRPCPRLTPDGHARRGARAVRHARDGFQHRRAERRGWPSA